MKHILLILLLTSVSALSCEGPLPCGVEASALTSEDWQELFDGKPSVETLLDVCSEIFWTLHREDLWTAPEVRRQQVATMQQAYSTTIDLINKEASTNGREVRRHNRLIEYYTDLTDRVMKVDLYDPSLETPKHLYHLYETENKTEAGQQPDPIHP